MASAYTQDARVGELKTGLGADKLVLVRFEGFEGISELFEYRIEALSETDGSINFDAALGKNCTIILDTLDGGKRYFAGTLVTARLGNKTDQGYRYNLVLRPWLWLLSKRANSQIFHDKTAPDIIREIFSKHGGLAVYEISTTKSYPTLEYCVQHRESDLAFVCRLMEAHGLSYHFVFSDDEQKLIVGDGNSAYGDVAGKKRTFVAVDRVHERAAEHLSEWHPERAFQTGKVTLNDYDFKQPTANLVVEKPGSAGYEHADLEAYDHPGKYTKQGDGELYAQAGIDMHQAMDVRFSASGDAMGLIPGFLMELTDHPDGAQNREYLVLRCSHSFVAQDYRSNSGGGGSSYRGSYELMSSDVPFSPPPITPRPIIAGPQTAKVVGDGEIDCDEYGRIKVHFHWNREDEALPEGQSMWCRVAQVWAGAEWGGIFIPRVGMEVLVQFLDGDPDRPVVMGTVYNEDNLPPYPLPSEKNKAGWKSHSTENAEGFNQIVFDDTAGDELVDFQAQKDLRSLILNNEEREVDNDRKTTIMHDDTLDVMNEIKVTAMTKITITVGASTIVIDPVSITLTSPTVSIVTTAEFKSESALVSNHTAGAPMSFTAPLIKIN